MIGSATATQLKVRFRRLVYGSMKKDERIMLASEFETFKENLEREEDSAVISWEPIIPKAKQLFTKTYTFPSDRGPADYHEIQVVDYLGQFLLRHYKDLDKDQDGNPKCLEIPLGSNTDTATDICNTYLKQYGFPESMMIDDLAMYCGHSYALAR